MAEAPASATPVPASGTSSNDGPDGVGLVAYLVFVLVGGLLVFGLARALLPAAEAQLSAPCRSIEPSPRRGAAPELALAIPDDEIPF